MSLLQNLNGSEKNLYTSVKSLGVSENIAYMGNVEKSELELSACFASEMSASQYREFVGRVAMVCKYCKLDAGTDFWIRTEEGKTPITYGLFVPLVEGKNKMAKQKRVEKLNKDGKKVAVTYTAYVWYGGYQKNGQFVQCSALSYLKESLQADEYTTLEQLEYTVSELQRLKKWYF